MATSTLDSTPQSSVRADRNHTAEGKLTGERNQGRTISMSAMKAGMSRTPARKYLRQNDVTEQRRVPHTWGTREDPLKGIWPRAEEMLRQAPELEAKALFEHLAAGRLQQLEQQLGKRNSRMRLRR